MKYIIDAGVENIHIMVYRENAGGGDIVLHDCLLRADDRIQEVLKRPGLFKDDGEGRLICDGGLYITGKLSEIVRSAFGRGIVIMPAAALWSGAKELLLLPENRSLDSLGIVEASASGYMAICVESRGELQNDNLTVNPRCGAGSGININRILEKLDIGRESVDEILSAYLGEAGKEKRQDVGVRSDRCGVFSSSATISDKNQGIPLDYALAVTMKSEILKACRKMGKAGMVCLTGRIFSWRYARDCAGDYFSSIGVTNVEYDKDQSILIRGIKRLAETIGEDNFKTQNRIKLRKKEKSIEFPSFAQLKERFSAEGLFERIPDPGISTSGFAKMASACVNIGLDVGSTMAKMAVTDAAGGGLLFVNSYNNHGDTIETIKHIFTDLCAAGVNKLKVQNIGITGSGRYQVQKSLQAVYPAISERVFTLVENYAHAAGSAEYTRAHIAKLKDKGIPVNEDFSILVDIGGEDTKISVIALSKNELFDNAMNIKCSAGTGSLMDTLKTLFGIPDIKEACRLAYEAPRAYAINATCAVFLMENARKMQASGYSKDDILASCNYAIVENMARTLWNQIEFPANAVVLLHGQTMLSDPLPLAVTNRIQEFTGTPSYCLVPPLPGHRACIGLIQSMEKTPGPMSEEYIDLNDFTGRTYERKIITCRGAACGDADASCSRTRLVSAGPSGRITLTLGGCSAVNEMQSRKHQAEQITVPDAYREIWEYIAGKLPRSDREDRLVIPRSFAVSEQAYFFGKIFEHLSIPVHCDDVTEDDIISAQPLFTIDTCAPNIGAAGQFMRLAGGEHGIILVPQIDYLPTGGASLGRTCTTNQGGVVIAMHFAKMRYPDARFLFFNISLKNNDPVYITSQIYSDLQPVFEFYNRSVTRDEFAEAVELARSDNERLTEELSVKAAGYLEYAIEERINVSVISARGYILNPGIYDSHIGKLLRDKGVIALPSYALETGLDKSYGYMYWRNPHDILTKIDAIANKRLHETVIHPKLKEILRKIERGLTETQISIVQVSTFRCGPDSVTTPTTAEITKKVPSLFIQSDAMIKELAHLENRVNTHLNQINKRLHEEISHYESGGFDVEVLNEFVFDGINRETDVLYVPTLSDNRILSAVMRAAGITAIDNYEDEGYDLVTKVKTGRKYAGDFVCVPLSAVYADILLAVQDFAERKKKNDPLVAGKNRVLVFMNGGDGPCRLGQYVDIFKLLLYRQFRNKPGAENLSMDFQVKILVNMTSAVSGDNYNSYIEEWVGYQGFQAVILQAVLHSIFMKGAVLCSNNEEYSSFIKDYYILKQDIYYILEKKIIPWKAALSLVKFFERKLPKLKGVAKYFCYGLYNNNGLRPLLKRFSKKWIRETRKNPNAVQVYVDGEVYVRVAQIEELLKILIDEFGFQSFELNYTSIWAFLEYILENKILVIRDELKRAGETLNSAINEDEKITLTARIEDYEKNIGNIKGTVSNFRNIFAGPLYKAAGIEMPYAMEDILKEARAVLPTLKPHGELAPYTGEAIKKLKSGVDLFINIAPEGCMVSSMGEILTPKIMEAAGCGAAVGCGGRIQHLFSTDGEINEELLLMAFLKKLGPEKYYRK